MQTVAVRELSGELITRVTARGQILGITNMGSLVGVLVPLTREIIQHMATRDAADVQASAHQADAELRSGQAMSTLSELLSDQDHEQPGSSPSPVRVSIRQLSGARLDEAGRLGQILLVSSGRVTIALIVPVTRAWLERLVETRMKHFLEGGSLGAEPEAEEFAEDAVIPPASPEPVVPAVGLLTPRRTVPPQTGVSGREINMQRAIGIRIVADPPEGLSRLQGVVTDMLARVIGEPITCELTSMDEGEVYHAILALIDDLGRYIGPDERTIGVGLEIGGHVDGGRVIYSPNAHWGGFPLADRINAALGLPVVLENDANALAILERRFDGASDDNLAVIIVTDLGVGSGFVLDGRVFRGVRGMAGEIGHIPLGGRPGRELGCRCGNYDCLECAATPNAIDEALKKAGFDGGYRAALEAMDTPLVKEEFKLARRGSRPSSRYRDRPH